METTQLDLFRAALPARPYCTDDPATGVMIRARMAAIRKAYVQANGPHLVRWLCFDVDRPGAAWDWRDADVGAPNLAVENPDTQHAHLLYSLAWPLPKSPELHYTHQLRYGAAVEAAYRDALQADIGYSGLLVQNPLHPRWKVFTWEPACYDLAWMADYRGVDLRRYRDARTRLPDYGLGRNCTLFHDLRLWAYRAIRLAGWPGLREWHALVRAEASRRNQQFPVPLPDREAAGIARSVARWTYANITREGFSERQAARKRKDTARRRAESERKAQLVLAFPGWSSADVERMTGIPRGTVRRLRSRGVHEPYQDL